MSTTKRREKHTRRVMVMIACALGGLAPTVALGGGGGCDADQYWVPSINISAEPMSCKSVVQSPGYWQVCVTDPYHCTGLEYTGPGEEITVIRAEDQWTLVRVGGTDNDPKWGCGDPHTITTTTTTHHVNQFQSCSCGG